MTDINESTGPVPASHPYIGTKRRWIEQRRSSLFSDLGLGYSESTRRPRTPFTVTAGWMRPGGEPTVRFDITYDDGGRTTTYESVLAEQSEPVVIFEMSLDQPEPEPEPKLPPQRVFRFIIDLIGVTSAAKPIPTGEGLAGKMDEYILQPGHLVKVDRHGRPSTFKLVDAREVKG